MTQAKQIICKIQLPIMTNNPTPLALAYNRDRSVFVTFPVTPELEKRFGREMKKFFHYEQQRDGTLKVNEVATWQSW